jgi:murein DD-endopeptidase MepM/ murein hydrolase activator NlpD
MELHTGVDIPGFVGAPIKATAGGKVSNAGWFGGYGMTIIINHENGFRTIYSHLDKFLVNAGEEVVKGQIIAHCGSTGLSTGPHVHYEIRYFNKPINPNPYLDLSIFKLEPVVNRTRKDRWANR